MPLCSGLACQVRDSQRIRGRQSRWGMERADIVAEPMMVPAGGYVTQPIDVLATIGPDITPADRPELAAFFGGQGAIAVMGFIQAFPNINSIPAVLLNFDAAPKSIDFLRNAESACLTYLNNTKPLYNVLNNYEYAMNKLLATFKEQNMMDVLRNAHRKGRTSVGKYVQATAPGQWWQINELFVRIHPLFQQPDAMNAMMTGLLLNAMEGGRDRLYPDFLAPLLTLFKQLQSNIDSVVAIGAKIRLLQPLAAEVARISTVAADANQQVSVLTGQLGDTKQRALVAAQQAADALAAFKAETVMAAAQTAAANQQTLDTLRSQTTQQLDALRAQNTQQLAAAAQQASLNVTNLQNRHAQEMAAAAQTAATALANLRTENAAQAAATAQQTATTLANLRAQHAQQLAAAEQRAAQALDNLRAQNTQAAVAAAKQASDELAALRSDFAAQAAAATEKAAMEAAAAAQVLSEAQAERDAVSADLKKANAELQKAQDDGKTLRTLLYAAAAVGAVYYVTSQR